jgi:hypothetical protein
MCDRTCPKCKLKFKYPSVLRLHVKSSFHCLTSEEDIEKYISENTVPKEVISSTIIKCSNCELTFTKISSLTRHNKESKCAKKVKENESKKTKEEYINQIKNLDPNLAKKIEKLFKKEKEKETNIQLINNTTNNITNIENQNTINNIINQTNNTINILQINPFGLEDVREIPISEMIMILNSGDNAGLHIIKAIYSKIENKNFYKPNISRSEIACLNEDFQLTIYKTREFADALFDRCLALLHHMLYICKNEITLNNIRSIYENIENIETTMRNEIYEKKLQNIIEAEVRNYNLETKNKISKYIKDIKELPDIHNTAKNKIKKIKKLTLNSNNEYKITFSDKEINELIGEPKRALGLTEEEIQLDMRFNRYEETKFYKYWKDRIILERNIINENNYKNGKIQLGDIINTNKKINAIEQMLDIIKHRYENTKPGDYINLDVGERFSII